MNIDILAWNDSLGERFTNSVLYLSYLVYIKSNYARAYRGRGGQCHCVRIAYRERGGGVKKLAKFCVCTLWMAPKVLYLFFMRSLLQKRSLIVSLCVYHPIMFYLFLKVINMYLYQPKFFYIIHESFLSLRLSLLFSHLGFVCACI